MVAVASAFFVSSNWTQIAGHPEEIDIPIVDDPLGQALNWTADTRLTYEPAGSLLPDLAAEQENLHLVWVDWRGTTHYVHARSPYDTETIVLYSVSAIDYAGNYNTTPVYSYQVTAQDVIPPEVSHEPMTDRETGRELVIEAVVRDNSQVDSVRLDYVDVKGDRFNISMNLHLDDPRYYFTYRATIPPQMTEGDVNYFIWARDAEGITNRTRDYSITISSNDAIPPLISHNPPKTKIYGYEVHIAAKVFDNSEVESVGLNYTDVRGNPHSVTMLARGNQTYTFGIPPQPFTGTLVYTIWARDVNLNVNRTLSHSVLIVAEDKDPPTIEHTPITNGVVGYWKPIHAFVHDNFGIVRDARLNIDGGSTNMGRLSTESASALYYKRSTDGGRTWDDGLG
ncbi:MAG: hypothetical protein KAW09_06380, partial [Thermoplasmata archaeon]|nr:hypothetical protein [Thermoplasmata archaeon]